MEKKQQESFIKDSIITPIQKFTRIESFSGILLFSATVIALILANSPIGESFNAIWEYKIGISSKNFHLVKPLILWINDGLMAIFFFVIGLEIKRELMIGELNTFKKASLPLIAAVGGMIVPVSIYLLFNQTPETHSGWGIPMATDIAFSLAILTLLGKRVPVALKVFLTAFAIVDDLGAVLVIALFYSEEIKWMLLLYAMILFVVLLILSRKNLYSNYILVIVGAVIWYLFLKAGIHPTIAGVLLAFTVPISQKIDIKTYNEKLKGIVARIARTEDNDKPILKDEHFDAVDQLEEWTSKVHSPLQHLEHKLHNWVAYFIMPVFAFSNSGVIISSDFHLDFHLIGQISGGLILGKSIGITLFSWIAIKFGLAARPAGSDFKQIIGIAFLAGVGFTMSIFIANLAFAKHFFLLDSAKLGILVGSLISGIVGYLILRKYTSKDETSKV
ncbi:Na+/H+ antiporter NhaA [Saccharicrinis sp. FJH54]|uniref:Na+/H+ antiporter NhaA n=1 Tax=Saccharicrinis sp. FJH54 TaxID=3344665 RepID=UPI0035D406F2